MSREALKYKLLFVLSVIVLISLLVFLTMEYFMHGAQREMIVVAKSLETAAYDLFDKQFTRLLTVISILFGAFGLIVPFLSFLFQRESLKEERTRIMNEVYACEKKVLAKLELQEDEISQSMDVQKKVFAEQMAQIEKQLKIIIEERDAAEREMAYRIGRHFFLSGNIPQSSPVTKMMSWFYAVEQFSRYPGYKNCQKMIDATLANICGEIDIGKNQDVLGIHWDYRLEALRILRKVSHNSEIKTYLRNAAYELAQKIKGIKVQGFTDIGSKGE
jgi:hypothetical protein